MAWQFSKFSLVVAAIGGLLSACSPASERSDIAEIHYEVGPCYGMCPVYTVKVDTTGEVLFTGERFTGVEGTRSHQAGVETFIAAQNVLNPWLPSDDQAHATPECGPRATDLPHYTVTWTTHNGEQTVLKHDTGCQSEAARELTATLRGLDALLEIESWVRPSEPTA